MENRIEWIGALGIEWQTAFLAWVNPRLQSFLEVYQAKNIKVELIPDLMQVQILDFLIITLGVCLGIWLLLRKLM